MISVCWLILSAILAGAQTLPYPGPRYQGGGLPNIAGLSASAATVGSTITISGTSFGTTGSVKFNGSNASISSWSTTSIVAFVPDSTNGNVTVSTSFGTSNGVAFQVIPHISSLSATSGYIGDSITVSGTGFQSSGVVKFTSATATTGSWAHTSIGGVTVPTSLGAGNKIVTVTAPSGGQTSNSITYTVSAPHIDSLSPNNGTSHSAFFVTINGHGFGDGSSTVVVTVDGSAVSWSNQTSTTLRISATCGGSGTTQSIQVQINGSSSNSATLSCT